MRYDKTIIFIKNSEESHYDPELGEWIENDPETSATVANVTDIGTNRSVTLFGHIKQGAKVIRLMPLFVIPEWDSIEIDGKNYELTTERVPLERHTLIIQEAEADVQENG